MSKKQCLSPQEIRERLEAAGVQATNQRLVIAQYVLCEGAHPTVEEIKSGIEGRLPLISQATVYNTVNTLVEAGLLRTLRVPGEDKVRFDGNIEAHHHFICKKSGRVFDLAYDDVQIANLDALKRRFRVDNLSVCIEGEMKKSS